MPSIRYINQSAPFWDFIASLEQQGAPNPMNNTFTTGEEAEEQNYGWGPWGRGFPHRPHPHGHGPPPNHGPHGHHHRRGGPPPPQDGPSDDEGAAPPYDEKDGSPATEKGEPSAPREGSPEGRRGRCGPKGKHGHGPCGGKRGVHGFGGRGGRGGSRGPPWARGVFPFGGRGFGGFGGFGDFFNNESRETGGENFKPEVDVFDTESSYVLHLSLPGAKKEDVGVSWDSEKSELTVAGVVHRPGDEEFLQTLAMDERKVGVFERKIRLGSLANPANVDVDAISAKLEDGILRVEVPKLDKDYVEVKMVDIE
jgi:HSP20 family protein